MRDLEGLANIILCRFLILTPVEKVPYDAHMIALVSFSTIALIFSRSNASV